MPILASTPSFPSLNSHHTHLTPAPLKDLSRLHSRRSPMPPLQRHRLLLGPLPHLRRRRAGPDTQRPRAIDGALPAVLWDGKGQRGRWGVWRRGRGRVCDVRGRGRQCLLGMGMSSIGVDERVEGGLAWKRMAFEAGF